MDKPNTREEAFVFFCVFFFLAWSVRWGVFSWFQSATAPLDVTKSFTLDFYFFLYWLASWFQTSSRDNLHVGELTAHQHRQVLTVRAFFIYLFIFCPVHPSILWSFIHLSNHSSRRKPVPAAPPNGSAIICRRSVQSLLFRHMHVSPKWCQDGVASSVVQHMLRAQSSFPPDDLPPPALMNQDRSETEKGRLVGADKLPLIKFCLFFFLFPARPPSIYRPAAPAQSSPKPWANGAGKPQTSELSVGPSPSPGLHSSSISVTPPAPKGKNDHLCCNTCLCLKMI